MNRTFVWKIRFSAERISKENWTTKIVLARTFNEALKKANKICKQYYQKRGNLNLCVTSIDLQEEIDE